ncbi:unnamed protein product [Blepharisma stoltei]|uniref:Uncharacterized protein n=1 Tax=Blepharisma stoltei TaxID=1481888 RepID=A0AAU9K1Z5_9CILI|nr:unnamed protein product [Blepharisma stoltei]
MFSSKDKPRSISREIQEASARAKEKTRTDKSGYMKVGDVIVLMFKSNNNGVYSGFLSADGVISQTLVVIPRDSESEKNANSLARSCLFRVENARRVNEVTTEKADSELKMTLGKALTYGERIQLRHLHSMGFINVNAKSIALEPGCLQVTIENEGSEHTWFEIVPVNKLRRDGEMISYGDSISFQSLSEKSQYFLHCYESASALSDRKLEVNASGKQTEWKPRRYMAFNLSSEASNFVTTGDSFRIYHRISQGYLSVNETQIIGDAGVPEAYLEKKNKSSNSLWELQRVSSFVGGTAKWEEQFRIKHLATGFFLKESADCAELTSNAYAQGTLFRLIPDSETAETEIRFGTILSLQTEKYKFIQVRDEMIEEQYLRKKKSIKYKLGLATGKKDYATIAFLIEDVPEHQTAHVYKLSLMIPHLCDFYYYMDDNTITTDYLLENPERENFLKANCSNMTTMLKNLSKHIIHQNDSEVDIHKRQNSMREMGVIDGLMAIAELIQNKLDTTGTRAGSRPGHQDDNNIASKYLIHVQNGIYRLVYESIKGNSRNCQNFDKYEHHLVAMLSKHINKDIGNILREIFCYTSEFSLLDEKKFSRWFNYLEPISETPNNIQEQTLYLTILKYLCENKGAGVLKFQVLARKCLLDPETHFSLIRFHIVNKRPCVEFDFPIKTHTVQDILKANPRLSAFGTAKDEQSLLIDEEITSAIFYLEDICKLDEYASYLAATIDLIASICLGRYKMAIQHTGTTINASLSHIQLALKNADINDKVRAAYANLCRVLYIDVDPYIPCTSQKTRCFSWDDKIERVDETTFEHRHENLNQVKAIIQNFWSYEGDVKINKEQLGRKLKLVVSFIKVTRSMIDLEIEDYEFIEFVMQPICFLITEKSGDESHWCTQLTREVRESLSNDYNPSLEKKHIQVIEEVLSMLQVLVVRRENLQLYNLLRLFWEYNEKKNTNEELTDEDLKVRFEDTLKLLDWDVEDRSKEQEIEIINKMDEKFIQSFSYQPITNISKSVHYLDIYLLELLFDVSKSKNKEIRKRALELILNGLNSRKLLKKEMIKVEFLTDENTKDFYLKLLQRKRRLNETIKTLTQGQEESHEASDIPMYNEALKDSTVITLEFSQLFKNDTMHDYKRVKYQNLLMQSGVYNILIDILYLKHDESQRYLLRHALTTLYHFCWDNKRNQKVLFPHIHKLLDLIGISFNVTKLIAQVLSGHTRSEIAGKVIVHIFELIETHDNEFHLLQLLRTFIIDEHRKIIPRVQIDILKGIFNSKAIRQMHMQTGNIQDFLSPHLGLDKDPVKGKLRLRYHLEVINCIIACTTDNRFGIFQGRKLIPLIQLKNIFKKENLNLYCKKAYLRYLYQVYMVGIEGGVEPAVSLNGLEDVFRDIFLHDLSLYRETADDLIRLSLLGEFDSIPCKFSKLNKWDTFKKLVADSKAEELIGLDSEFSNRRLSPEVIEPEQNPEQERIKDYWNYLSGNKSWHSEKDGLVHILRDMMLSNSLPLSETLIIVLQDIRELLHDMSDYFQNQEVKFPELDFSNIIMTINLCRECLPMSGIEKMQENPEGNELDQIVARMREYIIEEKLSLEEAFSVFDVDRNGNIEYEEFRKAIKNTLGNVRSADIEKAFFYLDADHDGYLRFKEFANKLRKYFSKVPHLVKINKQRQFASGGASSPVQAPNQELIFDQEVKNGLESFSGLFSNLCKDQDVGVLVRKIKDRFVDPAIQTKNLSILKEFISKLGTAFRKKKHKISLLKMLRMLVPESKKKEIIFDSEENEMINNYEYLQNVQSTLSEAGVLELALGIINDGNEFDLINEAVKLLLCLLRFGNSSVQRKLLKIMTASDNSNLFSYIRSQLRSARDRIVEKAKGAFLKNPERAAGIIIEGSQDPAEIPHDLKDKISHVKNLIRLLQLFCENCFTKFQHYIRSQEDDSARKMHLSINMIDELAQFLINIREAGPYISDDYEARKLIPQCLETLIDACRGPCVENQLLVGKRRKFYKFINMALSLKIENRLFEDYFQSSIRLLSTLLEGELDIGIATMMIEEIDFKELADIAFIIYKEHIYPKMSILIQDRVDDGSDNTLMRDTLRSFIKCSETPPEKIPINEWRVIDIGFQIVIMTIRLRERFPHLEELNWIAFSDKVPIATKTTNLNSIILQTKYLEGRNEDLFKTVYSWIRKYFGSKKDTFYDLTMDKAYEFYSSLIGTVEIDRDNKLEICHFRIPSSMVFLSSQFRNDVIYKINRNSHEEKIKSLFHNSEKYQIYMTHIQKLSEFKKIAWWASKNPSLARMCFWLVVIINALLLADVKNSNEPLQEDDNTSIKGGVIFLGVILIFLSLFVYIFYMLENYPIDLYKYMHRERESDIYYVPVLNKLKGTVLMDYYIESVKKHNKSKHLSIKFKILIVLISRQNLFNFLYLLSACFAMKYQLLYAILLLDCIRWSKDLDNVLRSITQNRKQLILTLVLGLISIYLFGVAGFMWLGQYYLTQDEGANYSTYCNTLVECATSTLNYGIRNGGGIGDALMMPKYTDRDYFLSQLFFILFFIVINIILMNIIFGIIIDTFSELRDERQLIEHDMNNICFICGREKFEFELRGSGWTEHVQLEHNVYAYLAYIIYIRKKPLNECNGIEKYVKNKMRQNDVSFFPKNARCLLYTEEKSEEEKHFEIIEEEIVDLERSLISSKTISGKETSKER